MTIDDRRMEENPAVNYSRLLDERCLGKQALAARLLRNLLEESGPRWLEEAESAVKNGDMSGVARLGHAVKGSCKMIYAESMAQAATCFEDAGIEGSQVLAERSLQDLKQVFSETCQWLRENSQLLE